ncbi:replication A1-like protein, partial [Trifolium pratense]
MSQSSGGSMYTPEQKLCHNAEIMSLPQMMSLSRDTNCVTVVNTVRVRTNNKGWYYQACYKCPKTASGDKPPFKCGDGHPTETEIWKYRVDVDVVYANTEATFTFWDRECEEIFKESAASLRAKMIAIGYNDPREYPTTIDTIEGRTLAVRVKWQPKWSNGSVQGVHDGENFIEDLKAQFTSAQDPKPLEQVPSPFTE